MTNYRHTGRKRGKRGTKAEGGWGGEQTERQMGEQNTKRAVDGRSTEVCVMLKSSWTRPRPRRLWGRCKVACTVAGSRELFYRNFIQCLCKEIALRKWLFFLSWHSVYMMRVKTRVGVPHLLHSPDSTILDPSTILHWRSHIMKNTFSLVYKLVLPEPANSQNEDNSLCRPPTGKTVLLHVVQMQLLSLSKERRDFHWPACSARWLEISERGAFIPEVKFGVSSGEIAVFRNVVTQS